jgi:hypothetical protein
MSCQLRLFIQYDDNTPADEPAFTNDASTWDLSQDYFLPRNMDDVFRTKVLGLTANAEAIGEPATRGLPRLHRLSHAKLLEDEDVKGWITAADVKAILQREELTLHQLTSSTRMLVEVLFFLADRFGPDRVRLIYAMYY